MAYEGVRVVIVNFRVSKMNKSDPVVDRESNILLGQPTADLRSHTSEEDPKILL